MAKIHFLNVLEGDCNIIQHGTGRVTVIDVSNAYNAEDTAEENAVKASAERAIMLNRTNVPSGKINYHQKKSPDNPIDYLKKLGIKEIMRFILTHPDMDHMDGIRDLYTEFNIINTWDTNNTKEIDLKGNFAGYNKEDWEFYLKLRAGKVDTKRLVNHANDLLDFWNEDGITILAPTLTLEKQANEGSGDYHDLSYVLLYSYAKKEGGTWKFLFAGDSHDATWEYILKHHKDKVENVDVLFAPHHGRDSKRDYTFLATLKPKVTLLGNASSEYLAYSKYKEYSGVVITNNQAGYVVVDVTEDEMSFYVKNFDFARDLRARMFTNPDPSTHDSTHDGYFIFRYPAVKKTQKNTL